MAGHSQFKNIMHRKGKQDALRSKLFAKLAREITVAARSGLADPNANSRLRLAVQNARAENMPKDSIDRAIRKAEGGDAEDYEAIRYEGYGPGGAAIIVEALTDNRNRTAGVVRSLFLKYGGNLAETGSVAFLFSRLGEIEYKAGAATAEAMLEATIEAGADDVLSDSEKSHRHVRVRKSGRGCIRAGSQAGRCRTGVDRVSSADRGCTGRGTGCDVPEAGRRPGRRR